MQLWANTWVCIELTRRCHHHDLTPVMKMKEPPTHFYLKQSSSHEANWLQEWRINNIKWSYDQVTWWVNKAISNIRNISSVLYIMGVSKSHVIELMMLFTLLWDHWHIYNSHVIKLSYLFYCKVMQIIFSVKSVSLPETIQKLFSNTGE